MKLILGIMVMFALFCLLLAGEIEAMWRHGKKSERDGGPGWEDEY